MRAELAERGHEGLTVDGVATRAGVHRATVYRRWRDVGGLIVDVERGELPGTPADARGLLVAATAPVYHQLVLLRAEPDPYLPERAAEAAVLAAAAGAFSARGLD
ncbi:TetR family transcriptional regulator [Promicromonospora sp. Marseille-Q5078]